MLLFSIEGQSLLDSSLCSHLKAAPAMCLHVPHPANGLDLGVVGTPFIPVLVRTYFKDVLEASVARILVTHPSVRRNRKKKLARNVTVYSFVSFFKIVYMKKKLGLTHVPPVT